MIWERLSTLSAWICGITAIIHIFFGKYFKGLNSIFIVVESLTLIAFLSSELIKLIIKIKSKNKRRLK
jgi:hypothetical protein